MSIPFLGTEWTLIDVTTRELIMRVNDEKVVFNIFKAIKYPESTDDCFAVNVVHGANDEIQEKHYLSNPLEQALDFSNLVDNYEEITTWWLCWMCK